jgi:hypothetical protein
MYTIRNSNNGQQTTCKDMAQVKRILKSIAKQYGKAAVKGIYVDRAGDKDPYYATDLIK